MSIAADNVSQAAWSGALPLVGKGTGASPEMIAQLIHGAAYGTFFGDSELARGEVKGMIGSFREDSFAAHLSPLTYVN